jgi:hypothetical protein
MAAHIFAVLIFITILFQLALAAGAPWGSLAMGGKHPGRFPSSMRIGAVVQAIILGLLAVIVYTRAGILLPHWYVVSKTAIWFVVAISALSTVLNLITPSKWERILWAPVAIIMLACSLMVALQ